MKFRRDDRPVLLDAGWWLTLSPEPLDVGDGSKGHFEARGSDVMPASVPGSVELDLLANGRIPEPFEGRNILDLRWLEQTYAYYGTSFVVAGPPDPNRTPVIDFEGLDCDATVYLNGTVIHRSQNMLIEHRAPVGDALIYDAPNVLCVELSPVLERARSADYAYPAGLIAEGSGYEGLYVRKAPHMFGWDIMPRAVSAGIWRPITLRFLPIERLDWVWIDTISRATDSTARLLVRYRTTSSGPLEDLEIVVAGTCGSSHFDARAALLFDAGSIEIDIEDALLWWPKGRGEPNLYDVQVTLLRRGEAVDSLSLRHGIRTVVLDRTSVTTEDGAGEFRFIVNGDPIFVLGTNWVPLDAYHARDSSRLASVLDLLGEIGCNMVRCWGGNVYESDAFFDWCDEHGVMVWQDFAMACAIYPQDLAFQEVLRTEVTAVARRLRQHPSLVLWAGDNECDQKHIRTGQGRDPNLNVLTRSVIPEVLRLEDPSRVYLPSSPYIDHAGFLAGERFLPEDHLWGPRIDFKGDYYSGALCHFASEIGYLGAPSVESIRRFITAPALWPPRDNAEWLLHGTAPIQGRDIHAYRIPLLVTQIKTLFGDVPETLDRFVAASQASQAEALKYFIESFRAAKWRRTGIIWWNLADGWPQFSDAVVDYYGHKKLAFEVVKRSQADVVVICQEPVDGRHLVVVCNDRPDVVAVNFSVTDVTSGVVLLSGSSSVIPDGVTAVGSIPERPGEARFLSLSWETRGVARQSHYLAVEPPVSLERYLSWLETVGLSI